MLDVTSFISDVVPCNPKFFKNNFILTWNHGLTSAFMLANAWPIRIKIKHSFY